VTFPQICNLVLRWPGHSRPKDGVASLAYGRPKDGVASLAYGRPKDGVASLAYCPGHRRFGK
jgi:hypothetical protein